MGSPAVFEMLWWEHKRTSVFFNQYLAQAGEMGQWAKVLAAKSDCMGKPSPRCPPAIYYNAMALVCHV